ncbi:GDP-mannose 4,6-dehydratase [Chitinivibrio alkaliphilus]|uniref:NAD-dependent epimerase/dehydratase n=1 Tax=Chitinivibrio alkaliphilus ACht1 TaxID=1313304 RepID=U7D9K0_9BACT|nr:GDP-mannose 4,6-dehydratase [Chitinivibrio alkaliphilus]ERP31090.1 NAD-dependent epimerase/dehydratase [Chitinivibrio alkaliphilus ACht1]
MILITGAAGFIGFHLAQRLLREGYSVIGVDNFNDYYDVSLKVERWKQLTVHEHFEGVHLSLESLNSLQGLFKRFKIDVVCNLAAQAGVRYSIENPHVYAQSNLTGFLNILEMCRHYSVKRLVYASSSSVYGGNRKVFFSESDTVDSPVSLYAASKKANELMAHTYSHLYDIQTVGVRFFTVYGPWGRPDMAYWTFTKKILADMTIPVFNHGDMKRDFTYIDDIITGIEAALFTEGLDQYEIFNLGNHRAENLMDFVNTLGTALGKKVAIELLPMQPGDVKETYADIAKAQKKLGYSPKTPISEGIPRFVEWYTGYFQK